LADARDKMKEEKYDVLLKEKEKIQLKKEEADK
jgi:hypothetical protein